MERSASAHWTGDLKSGKGAFSGESGVLSDLPYDFGRRFGDEKGTNPEELIAAAHASCFAMATSAVLGESGITAESIDATARVTLEFIDEKPTVTKSHLVVTIKAPGADKSAVEAAADGAKAGCPISRLIAGTAEVSMDATVEV